MSDKLLKLIDGLSVSDDQKDYLKILIQEEKEELLKKIVDYVEHLEEGGISKYVVQTEDLTDAGSEEVNNLEGSDLDMKIDILTDTLKYGDDLYMKAEETYNRVDINLRKNKKWLEKLLEKVKSTKRDESGKFADLLSRAQLELGGIDEGIKANWQDFGSKKINADKSIGGQVAFMKDEIIGSKDKSGDLPTNVEEMLDKLCEQYREKMDKMAKVFSGQLDIAAEEIEKLTEKTSGEMKGVMQKKKLEELKMKILGEETL